MKNENAISKLLLVLVILLDGARGLPGHQGRSSNKCVAIENEIAGAHSLKEITGVGI